MEKTKEIQAQPQKIVKKEIKVIKRASLYRRLIDKVRRLFKGVDGGKIQFIKEFLGYVFIYGLLVNYMLTGIFGVKFSIFYFLSYGVMFFLIKEELPQIWAKFRPSKRQ